MPLGTSLQTTRDNIGNPDSTKDIILLGPFQERIVVEEGPTILSRSNIGDSFVLGIVTNAILGTTVLGEVNFVSGLIERVVNPNNTFHEHFRFSNFNDTSNTTGAFSTTNFNVSLDKEEVFQTEEIFDNVQGIFFTTPTVTISGSSATFTVDLAVGGTDVTITEGNEAT